MSCPKYEGNNKCALKEPSYEISQRHLINYCITSNYTNCSIFTQIQSSKNPLETTLEMEAKPKLREPMDLDSVFGPQS